MPAFKIDEARTGPLPQDDYYSCPVVRVGDQWAALLGHKNNLDEGVVILATLGGSDPDFFDKFEVEVGPNDHDVEPGIIQSATRDPLAVAISRAWSKAHNEGGAPWPWPSNTPINLEDYA